MWQKPLRKDLLRERETPLFRKNSHRRKTSQKSGVPAFVLSIDSPHNPHVRVNWDLQSTPRLSKENQSGDVDLAMVPFSDQGSYVLSVAHGRFENTEKTLITKPLSTTTLLTLFSKNPTGHTLSWACFLFRIFPHWIAEPMHFLKRLFRCNRCFLCMLFLQTSSGILLGTDARQTTAAEVQGSEATGESDSENSTDPAVKADSTPPAAQQGGQSGASATASSRPDKPTFDVVLKDAQRLGGLIPLYRKDEKLFADLGPGQLGRDFFVLISIARGIGDRSILGGMSWGDGDDWVWQFRQVGDNVQVVRRNVRFFADKGSPEEKAVDFAYTDSVLFSLPILTKGPSGGLIVELTGIFFSDLPQISNQLAGFSFAANRSSWASIKGFADNVEIEVAATYGSAGTTTIDTVPDSRGVTINVHYSISLLPQNSYRPRLADDRVGYFVTALKDFSQKVDEDRFVRYVNRWNLEKADGSAPLSPPRKPIVFWIEKTVPFKYRQPIREGIESWNSAFEKAGFSTAIEVRQQPDQTDWDPEDINYNTFRWITAGAGFAMGPSRVNPRTGQILDADIIFDADFLQFWRTEYETFTPQAVVALTGGDPARATDSHGVFEFSTGSRACNHCSLVHGHARETALAVTSIAAMGDGPLSEVQKEKLVAQGLKLVTMHEVGHTLGLRHNFKGSTMLSLADVNDVNKASQNGASMSVMDYMPANIMPKGKTQGDYYTAKLGPYDYWAIEYGYRQIPAASPESERVELDKIASRSGEPMLAYATDEDTVAGAPDPLSNRFDLGNDPLEFARTRAELVEQLMPLIVERMVSKETGYERVRQAFGVLLSAYGQSMYTASRLVGGLYTTRAHKADANAQAPFRVVEPQRQRDTLTLLEMQMFSEKPFLFSPELYNQLAATKWLHWGMPSINRDDYPVHEVILSWQDRVLSRLLDPLTLERIRDNELKVPADQDAFTSAELLDRLTKSVLSELETVQPGEYTVRKPAVSSLRRNLQRKYVARLGSLAMGSTAAPADCQSIASVQLRNVNARIAVLLANEQVKLDDYSRAHLLETQGRIQKVIDASLELPRL